MGSGFPADSLFTAIVRVLSKLCTVGWCSWGHYKNKASEALTVYRSIRSVCLKDQFLL